MGGLAVASTSSAAPSYSSDSALSLIANRASPAPSASWLATPMCPVAHSFTVSVNTSGLARLVPSPYPKKSRSKAALPSLDVILCGVYVSFGRGMTFTWPGTVCHHATHKIAIKLCSFRRIPVSSFENLGVEGPEPLMSHSGQSRHFDHAPLTSGLPRLADIPRVSRHVSKVPRPELASHRPTSAP